jgi:serine/threonine protein kinase
MDTIKAEQIESVPIIQRKSTQHEKLSLSLIWITHTCVMRYVVCTTYHWYPLFEYVNGGQTFDYIISHESLKEKQARKFSRQIANAMDYCHRNSIVHRDLNIENILMSETEISKSLILA